MFKEVDPKQSFPKMEEALVKYWKKNKTFEKSVKNPAGEKNPEDFVFYDGPPFATGLPHYGHLLAGTLKDVVPRYWTMQGYRVERKWGWDCHGLPIENLIEKELDLHCKKDIEKMGVATFNEACYNSVLRYEKEWKKTVPRMGRWVDMENDYKTMDPEYMESVWWVFKSLYDKGLVYEGRRSIHICPRCETPLSNFEVGQGYKDVTDQSVTAKFELVDEPGTFVLAWTTTPWTLPGNAALAVGAEIEYVKAKIFAKEWDKNGNPKYENIILAKEIYEKWRTEEASPLKERCRANTTDDKHKTVFEQPQIIDTFKGKTLAGKRYNPLFDYFVNTKTENIENAYRVITADFVSTEDGTGIVHVAPAFGEDDMQAGIDNHLPILQHVGMDGLFTEIVRDWAGKDCKKMDQNVITHLKEKGLVFWSGSFRHSYPHCWRCDTPLLNYSTASWYVAASGLRESMLKTNGQIHWSPAHIKEGRFGKWVAAAKDWSISRGRYWGTPIPIWRNSKDPSDVLAVGSIRELQELSGVKLKNLHKQFADAVKITQKLDIVYVRHGETDYNKAGKIQGGRVDNPLNATGKKQAEAVAEKLKNESFDLILTSDLSRAKATAKVISLHHKKTKVIVEEDLRERDFGKWEHQTIASLGFKNEIDFRLANPPDGESLAALTARVKKVLQKYSGKKVLLVCHRHIYFALENIVKGTPFEEAVRHEIENGVPHELTCEKTYERIPDVFDCWMEAGSMPYGQWHYPFENKEAFEKNFPANFIAEGVDQTRCWFYVLHVLANGLMGRPAFKNVIVNGIVLAEDGRKMSKRLKNYPDPNEVMSRYGADALRFFLMNSPVVQADDMRFSERGVEQVLRNMMLPVWNVYSFFTTYANIDGWTPEKAVKNSPNKLDSWIIAELNELIAKQVEYFAIYDLQKASNSIYKFVDDLTNWYIRRSRRRFWKSEDDADKNHAYSTLYQVLTTLCKVLAPFTPFMPEEIYRNLTGEESVHLSRYPKPDQKVYDETLIHEIHLAKTIVNLGLAARGKEKIKVRQPLRKVDIVLADPADHALLSDQLETIKEELNVKEINFVDDPGEFAVRIARPNAKLLGPKYGGAVQQIILAAKNGQFEQTGKNIVVEVGEGETLQRYELTPEEISIDYEPKGDFDVESAEGILIALDTVVTPELELEGRARDLVRQIQELRKTAGYKVDDRIQIALVDADRELLEKFGQYLQTETLATDLLPDISSADKTAEFEGITIKVKRV